MLRFLGEFGEGDLMRAPRTFGWFSIDFFWARPAFWRFEHEHGPARAFRSAFLIAADGDVRAPGCALDFFYFGEDVVECGGHQLMHLGWIVSFDEIRAVAVTAK